MLRAKTGINYPDPGRKGAEIRVEAGDEINASHLKPATVEALLAQGVIERDSVGAVESAVEGIAYHAAVGTVYHTRAECSLGNNIDEANRLPGKGGKALCKECAKA